ncbi:hypothetical protein [Actinomyces procaprae]|uniref:hypothetical protein n=1 Tax=Actinomyces procaprae TaxID=2560010 RepID=UPI00109D9067|nr:hypothetical protein [Actinomyces procaprae]
MTSTIIIRPTPAAELERGMLIRHRGETRQIVRAGEYDENRIVIYFHDGSDVRWSDSMVDVVVPPEPDPEPEAEAWPTAPVIRILDGHQGSRDIGGLVALRSSMYAYRLFDGGDEIGLILRDQPDAGIEHWESLSVVPTEAVRTLAARLTDLDSADPRPSPGCRIVVRAMRIAEAARDLVQVANAGEAVD